MFESLAAKGFALAVQMVGNRDDAAEIVQEGLLTLWKNRWRLDRNRQPRAWFYRVLRNLCVDRLRRRGRATAPGPQADRLSDAGAGDPSRIAEANERRARLRRELESLPAELREILCLRDFHNLPYAEIAAVLGIPAGTVMSRLHHARLELRLRMSGTETG